MSDESGNDATNFFNASTFSLVSVKADAFWSSALSSSGAISICLGFGLDFAVVVLEGLETVFAFEGVVTFGFDWAVVEDALDTCFFESEVFDADGVFLGVGLAAGALPVLDEIFSVVCEITGRMAKPRHSVRIKVFIKRQQARAYREQNNDQQ